MTINLSAENAYLGIIFLLVILQVSQWYYIFNLRRQMQSVWAQIATMALMFYAKENMKNESQTIEDQK